MSKREFLARLRRGLVGLPQDDLEERLIFYSEMIDDRMEEGLSEEEAVSAVGNVDTIAAQVVVEAHFAKSSKEKIRPQRRMRLWEAILLVLGSPIWLSLGVAAFVVVLSIYISLWVVIISLWVVFASLIACAFGGAVAGAIFACCGNVPAGFAMFGAGIICAGFSIFMFFGCKAATKGILMLTKMFARYVKKGSAGKEEAR